MQMNYNYLEIPFLMYQNSKTQMFDNILCWRVWPHIAGKMQNKINLVEGIWPYQTKLYMHMFLDLATLL